MGQPNRESWVRLTLAIVLGLASTAILAKDNKTLEAGVSAYHDEQYDEAVELFRPLAEEGHPKAQLYMGYLYRVGHGVPQNDQKAAKWYKKAAEQDVPQAQVALGLMYETGAGVKADYWEAEYWYNRLQRNGYCIIEQNHGGRLGDL